MEIILVKYQTQLELSITPSPYPFLVNTQKRKFRRSKRSFMWFLIISLHWRKRTYTNAICTNWRFYLEQEFMHILITAAPMWVFLCSLLSLTLLFTMHRKSSLKNMFKNILLLNGVCLSWEWVKCRRMRTRHCDCWSSHVSAPVCEWNPLFLCEKLFYLLAKN